VQLKENIVQTHILVYAEQDACFSAWAVCVARV